MPEQPVPLRIEFHLLDRQIVDRDGLLVGKVDDVELESDAGGGLTVTALLVGPPALARRIGGRTGRWLDALAVRLSPTPPAPPLRIAYRHVERVGSEVVLSIGRDRLPEPRLEAWLREHLIVRIPGGRRESE